MEMVARLPSCNSEFGWVVSGPTNDKDEFSGESVVNLSSIEKPRSLSIPNSQATSEDELSKSLHRFWEVESLVITEEHAAEEEFLRGVHYHYDEGRYEVNLPWKPGFAPISNGYAMCMKRLHQLRSRLNNDKSLLKEYDGIIKDQERMGIIEPAVDTEEYSHFLPHHGEDKETTKIRVVFDGSAKSGKDDLSLND